jgi:hypothetical protein
MKFSVSNSLAPQVHWVAESVSLCLSFAVGAQSPLSVHPTHSPLHHPGTVAGQWLNDSGLETGMGYRGGGDSTNWCRLLTA